MKAKPSDLPIEKMRGNIMNRLHQAGTQIQIWRALRINEQRHDDVSILDRYPLFTHGWPETFITTFVIQLCSLFDRGSDCITIKSYRSKLDELGRDTTESKARIDAAEKAIEPLRVVRDNYYAHRLAEGAMTDLIKATEMTGNRLFDIYREAREAVQSLLTADDKIEFVEPDPVPHLNRMIADLAAFHRVKLKPLVEDE